MNGISIPANIRKKMISCVQDAVGDDILEDMNRNNLKTTNSIPARIWDFINSNLINNLNVTECTIAKLNRGPWEMVLIYENTTQCIFTFMREKRFMEICKKQHKRKNMHYLDILTKQFNSELTSDFHQLSLEPHIFADEDLLALKVQELLSDLREKADLVRNHVLVLFDTFKYELISIRAVMLTSDLDIAYEEKWSDYIIKQESIIPEKVVNAEEPANNPSRNLKLKNKALERKKNKQKLNIVETQKEKQG